MADSPHPPPLSPPSVPHSPPPDVKPDIKPDIKPEVIAHATVVQSDGEVATKREDCSPSPATVGAHTATIAKAESLDWSPSRVKTYLIDEE